MALFDGKNIFGVAHRQMQFGKTRLLRETLPGVRGYRNYNLSGGNPDTVVWQIQGRLEAANIGALETIIFQGQDYMDGGFYNFTTNGGKNFKNCQMVDYRQSGLIKTVLIGNISRATCEVSATIEQASP